MDSDEVDIGTVRNLEASSWIPPHLEINQFSKSSFRRLSSPSAPDIMEDLHSNHPMHNSSLSRVRTFSHLRRKSGGTSDHDLPVMQVDKVARIRRWILCVAIVDFDLDVGPVLDCLYPQLSLSAAHRENIAFSSFPDSSIFETGSQIHSFKIAGPEFLPSMTQSTLPESPALTNSGFIYGYACFMQRRDSTSKRGYLQRSIVILSHHPFPSLFEEVVSLLAPLYLSHGNPMLETACQNISTWHEPIPGSTLELGFLGSVLRARIPHMDDELQFAEASSLEPKPDARLQILASIPPTIPSPLAVFSASLPSLWSIWELVILCEPILVFGLSPRITSLAVWWLRDFVRPIPLAGDFRPYVTIHDQDYTTLFNKNAPKVGLVVGVTNPFVLSVTKHWPNVLSLGKERIDTPSDNVKGKHLPRDAPRSGPPPGFLSTTHKRYTSKDRPLLKVWEEALGKGGNYEHTASQELRRHFSSRTASFLAPLNRYLNSLIPSPIETSGDVNKPKTKPRLKPFNTTQFLTSLKAHGTPLPFKSSSKQRDFYERWLRTPAFALWLAAQEEVVTGVLEDTRRIRT